jgi:hypothetical protein
MASRSLVLKVTVGKDDPERCNQALTVAAAAAASGVPVWPCRTRHRSLICWQLS